MTAADEKRGAKSVEWKDSDRPDSWHNDPDGTDSFIGPSDSQLPQEEAASSTTAENERATTTVDAPEAAASEDDDGRGRRRSKTIARKQMLRERRRMLATGTVPEIMDYDRPSSRSECRDAKRPCLYVSCRYHLYLDVNPVTGSIKLNFPDKKVWELEETCALDVAERGGITLEDVGDIMNLTRERIRQVEVSGLEKLKGSDVPLHTFIEGRELESLEATDEDSSADDS
jgi:hypothetical protein